MASLSSYRSSIKSIQRGVLRLGVTNLTANATITAVNTAKSIVNYCNQRRDLAANGNQCEAVLTLSGSTSVQIQVTSSGGDAWVSYEVVEYY